MPAPRERCADEAGGDRERRRDEGCAEQPIEEELAPVFDKRFVRWLTKHPASLYGLGIPPAQYRSLATAGEDDEFVVAAFELDGGAVGGVGLG